MWTRLFRHSGGLLLCWLSLSAGYANSQTTPKLTAATYNVENFLSSAPGYQFWYKADAVARVITDLNSWDYPAWIGLQEVENDSCLNILCRKLWKLHYDFIHYDSPDRRGIDVALLYDRNRVKVQSSRAVPVEIDEHTFTRDILYAKLICNSISIDSVWHVMVCHMPSQLGGTRETEWKRQKAFQVLQTLTDSIFLLHPTAQIMIMGDMNCSPKENIEGMRNLMTDKKEGTHKHQGIWTWLDQIYLSPAVKHVSIRAFSPQWILEPDHAYLGMKPKRCNISHFRWQEGYSDHLPVVITLVSDDEN